MRRTILGFGILFSWACTPGAAEYGPCSVTPDCQVMLQCIAIGPLLTDKNGNTYADAGVCRRSCQTSIDCQPAGEICGGNLFCSKDGGY